MLNFDEKENGRLIDSLRIAIESYQKNNQRSKITKENDVFYSQKSPNEQLLDDCYIDYASTLERRIKAVTMALNYNKPPVILAPCDSCMFPAGTYHNHPFSLIETGNGAQLVFYESIVINVNTLPYIITQQHQRLHTVINYFRDS